MPPFRLAHAWPGDHWPHSASSEAAFAFALARGRRRRVGPFDRNDVTWLLSALRAGATLDTVVTLAGGIRLQRLHSAYCELERRRAHAVAAWESLCATPTEEALREHGPVAAALLPVPVARLAASPVALCDAIDAMCVEITQVRELCDSVESAVAAFAEISTYAAQIEARRLWAPSGGCLWNDPYFLPLRVGELTPIRAVDLLGEERSEDLT